MDTTTRRRWALAFLLAIAASPIVAATGAPAWERTFRRDVPGTGEQSVMIARELADGSTMTVVRDNSGVTALRYDHAGMALSSSTVYPEYGVVRAAIDPFGGVFVASDASAGYGYEADVWIMKYDGFTGRPAWPSAVLYGSGNGHDDDAQGVLIDPVGDLVVHATNSYDSEPVLIKYAGSSGSVVWGPVSASPGQSARAVLDAVGNVYLARTASSGSSTHFFLTKHSASSGAIVWQRDEADHDLEIGALEADGVGNVVVAGSPNTFAGGFEASRYAGATGDRIWGPARYDAPEGNYSTAVDAAAVAADGSVVLFGHTVDNSVASAVLLELRGADGAVAWGPFTNTDANENLSEAQLSIAGNGDTILSTRFQTGPSNAEARTWRYRGGDGSIAWGPQVIVNAAPPLSFVGANGRVFVATSVFNGTDSDVQILERNGSTGAPAWGPVTFTGAAAGSSHFWDLAASPDGNVVVTGTVQGPDGDGSWATLKYDRVTGAVLWGPEYFPSASLGYSPWGVLTDASGDAVVAGLANGGAGLVKYSGSTGAQLWAAAAGPGINPTGATLDPSGNAIVTGYSFNGTGYDVRTVKISGSTGAVLWGPIVYDSGFDDFPERIAADPSGDVFIVGHSNANPYFSFVLKYSGANGAVEWGPVAHSDVAAWTAVDAAGDLFEVTYTAGIVTTKYSGATGAILWGPVSVPGSGYGAGVALDAAGNAFVTGSLYSPVTGYDYALIKYRGSDGTVLWGPVTHDVGGRDFPYGVVVDGSGNAVVTGFSEAASHDRVAATLSCDGATGALRWGPFTQGIARETVNGLAAVGSTVYVGATRDDVGYLVTELTESLGIATLPEGLVTASCGHPVDVALTAENGAPPYAFSVVGGALPPGVSLGPDGHLSGPPSDEGTFSFAVQAQDAAMATANRSYTLVVGPAGPLVPVLASVDDACQTTLSVEGTYAQYEWLPGGQSSSTLVVDPAETSTYGVVLDDGSSCPVRGAIMVRPSDPSCLAPRVLSISPASGPFPGTPVVVTGTKFQSGITLSIGGLPAVGTVYQSASSLSATTPALVPGTVSNVTVINPDGRYGLLLRAFATDFYDVSSANPFYSDIMKVLRAGITVGCGGANYCPGDSVTRAHMAVFLLKAKHGSFYAPPPCTGVFADTPCPDGFAVDWIEQLAAEGITGGCGGGNYCPGSMVTRAQMAAFLLKAEHGSSYVPPPCVGVFADVPCGAPFVDWIEQLFHENVTAGCGGGNYCPAGANTRAQMAVFLAKTLGLP
jgi:hypothetical protein